MNITDIMKKDFIKIKKDTPVKDVAKLFLEKKEDFALVVDDDNNLLGIITETDLIFQEKKVHIPTFFTFLDSMIFFENMSRLNEEIKKISASKAEELMTEDLITVSPSATIDEVATIMVEKKLYHIPVVENNKPVGVITKEGLLLAYLER
ncbi:MAG: CBS domain-containing protein [Proteobacteria bacterium]|nr:CBS domain-containing protein [Pseudomonadota bacterium]